MNAKSCTPWVGLWLALALLGAPSAALGQTAPWTLDGIVRALEAGVLPDRVLQLARERCLAFQIRTKAFDALRNAGAPTGLIVDLQSVCLRLAGRVRAPVPERGRGRARVDDSGRASAVPPKSAERADEPETSIGFFAGGAAIVSANPDVLVASAAVLFRQKRGPFAGQAVLGLASMSLSAIDSPGDDQSVDPVIGAELSVSVAGIHLSSGFRAFGGGQKAIVPRFGIGMEVPAGPGTMGAELGWFPSYPRHWEEEGALRSGPPAFELALFVRSSVLGR